MTENVGDVPDFEQWEFDHQHVENDWKVLAAWTYAREHNFRDEVRAKLSTGTEGYIFVPPHQLFGHELQEFSDLETATEYTESFLEDTELDCRSEVEESMGQDVFDLLEELAEIDENYVAPSDARFGRFQHVKTRFYREIQGYSDEVSPERVQEFLVDRDYEGAEQYLSQELEEETYEDL